MAHLPYALNFSRLHTMYTMVDDLFNAKLH
jgi:hypothetical protein